MTIIEKIRHDWSILAEHKHPFRFLIATLLFRSRIPLNITIQRRHYKLPFSRAHYSAILWADPSYVTPDEDLILAYLREGDIVVDVGANVGTLTLTAAYAVGTTGSVFSIEAHPRIFSQLTRNVAINGFDNVHLFNLAAGSESGRVAFSDMRSDDVNHVVAESRLSVQMITLDALLADSIDHVSLVKIDVEGYERFVCQGASKLLKKTDCIYIESYEPNFARYSYSTLDLVDDLQSMGFCVRRLTSSGLAGIPVPYKSDKLENLVAVKDLQAFTERSGIEVIQVCSS